MAPGRDSAGRFVSGGGGGGGGADVAISLGLDLDPYRRGLKNAASQMRRAGSELTSIGTKISGIFTGIGAAALKFSADFEKSLNQISTLFTGPIEGGLAAIGDQLKELSLLTGDTLGGLGKARYDIISAGITGVADSMSVLEASAKAGVAGASDVATAADLFTTALNSYRLAADQVNDVSDTVFTTIRLGKTTFQELGQDMGRILPTAAAAGESFQTVGAMLAVLTANGLDTAEAATSLNQLMLAIKAPADQAATAMREAGIETRDGLLQALVDLQHASSGQLDVMAEFIPNVRALRGALSAAADGGVKLTDFLNEMAGRSGATESAFDKMARGADMAFKRMKQGLQIIAVEIGDVFLEDAKDAADQVMEIVSAVREWISENGELIKSIASWVGSIGTALVAMGVFFKGIGLVASILLGLTTPIGWVVLALGTAIVAFLKFREDTVGVVKTLRLWLTAFGKAVELTFGKHFTDSVNSAIGALGSLASNWKTIFRAIKAFMEGEFVKGSLLLARPMIEAASQIEDGFADAVAEAFSDVAEDTQAIWDEVKRKKLSSGLDLFKPGDLNLPDGFDAGEIATPDPTEQIRTMRDDAEDLFEDIGIMGITAAEVVEEAWDSFGGFIEEEIALRFKNAFGEGERAISRWLSHFLQAIAAALVRTFALKIALGALGGPLGGFLSGIFGGGGGGSAVNFANPLDGVVSPGTALGGGSGGGGFGGGGMTQAKSATATGPTTPVGATGREGHQFNFGDVNVGGGASGAEAGYQMESQILGSLRRLALSGQLDAALEGRG